MFVCACVSVCMHVCVCAWSIKHWLHLVRIYVDLVDPRIMQCIIGKFVYSQDIHTLKLWLHVRI